MAHDYVERILFGQYLDPECNASEFEKEKKKNRKASNLQTQWWGRPFQVGNQKTKRI